MRNSMRRTAAGRCRHRRERRWSCQRRSARRPRGCVRLRTGRSHRRAPSTAPKDTLTVDACGAQERLLLLLQPWMPRFPSCACAFNSQCGVERDLICVPPIIAFFAASISGQIALALATISAGPCSWNTGERTKSMTPVPSPVATGGRPPSSPRKCALLTSL